MIRRIAFTLLGLVFAGPAFADAKADLHAAFSKFLAQTAFRGNVTGNVAGRSIRSMVEFQAPDRYRVSSDGRPPSVIIGNTMYMNINGRSMKVPMPANAGVAQYRDASILAQLEHGLVAEDLGLATVGGAPAHKYRYTVSQPHPSTSTIWVSVASGLPVQLQTSRPMAGKSMETTINYSAFSDPSIKISAPQ